MRTRLPALVLAVVAAAHSRVPPGGLALDVRDARAVEDAGYGVGRETIDLKISGMTCASCVSRVEAALKSAPGVTSAVVNLATEKAAVEGVAGLMRPADLVHAVEDAGYDAEILTGDSARDAAIAAREEKAQKSELLRVIAAMALSAPLLLPMLAVPLPAWAQLALATPVQFIIGWRFYLAAWKALRAGTGNMDLLVALGTSVAFFYSVWLMAQPHVHHLYFEAAAFVIALDGHTLRGFTPTAIEQMVCCGGTSLLTLTLLHYVGESLNSFLGVDPG